MLLDVYYGAAVYVNRICRDGGEIFSNHIRARGALARRLRSRSRIGPSRFVKETMARELEEVSH
jgi:hypothetical protein